ncbi:hypothetical protein E5288_WYG020295 [Bos mutus]|uniref:Uncharacterized protein n=1 Tax=Bos mutus TaxID=72004 RepID=A0A6B0S6Q8_9CETA|nr:hypothetical protein [Bos mutus]
MHTVPAFCKAVCFHEGSQLTQTFRSNPWGPPDFESDKVPIPREQAKHAKRAISVTIPAALVTRSVAETCWKASVTRLWFGAPLRHVPGTRSPSLDCFTLPDASLQDWCSGLAVHESVEGMPEHHGTLQHGHRTSAEALSKCGLERLGELQDSCSTDPEPRHAATRQDGSVSLRSLVVGKPDMLYMTAGPWDPGLGTVGVVTVSWPKDRFRASACFTPPTTLQKLAGLQVTDLSGSGRRVTVDSSGSPVTLDFGSVRLAPKRWPRLLLVPADLKTTTTERGRMSTCRCGRIPAEAVFLLKCGSCPDRDLLPELPNRSSQRDPSLLPEPSVTLNHLQKPWGPFQEDDAFSLALTF